MDPTDPTPPELRAVATAARVGDLATLRREWSNLAQHRDDDLLTEASCVIATHDTGVAQRWHVLSPLDPGARVEHAHAQAMQGDLVGSERTLFSLLAEHPELALGWYVRVVNGCKGFATSEVLRRHRRLTAASPGHLRGGMAVVEFLARDEDSPWDEALQLARVQAAAVAPGRPARALPAMAHLAGWRAGRPVDASDLGMWDDVITAARESIDHPDFGRPASRNVLFTLFAVIGAALGRADLVLPTLGRMDAGLDPFVLGMSAVPDALTTDWRRLHPDATPASTRGGA